MGRGVVNGFAGLLGLFAMTLIASAQIAGDGWPTYGGDPGGMRYTASSQITRANVSQLTVAWTFHTGSIAKNRVGTSRSSFEATPILFGGLLYVTSPYDEIFAIDPVTGEKRWEYDPKLHRNLDAGILTSRGVAAWSAANTSHLSICATRIFVATMDRKSLRWLRRSWRNRSLERRQFSGRCTLLQQLAANSDRQCGGRWIRHRGQHPSRS